MSKNAIYAQSGGVTSVINATAAGVITACRDYKEEIGILYAASNGISGVLREELIDTSYESEEDIVNLRTTPGGAFGSCRYKLKSIKQNKLEYERLIEVFSAYDIGYFFYNGGNDSADTCLKVAQVACSLGYPIQAIHIPKTIDNDLVITDNCPGFGSVAKYIATSISEAGFDLKSMCNSSTQVFILEVMGRHAGWIAASSGLASLNVATPPHIILFPEVAFHEESFLAKVSSVIASHGYCVIVVSEGLKNNEGKLMSQHSVEGKDAFGHEQLGGVAIVIARLITKHLKLKCHYAISDYLQRSARHIASRVDVEQAYYVGYTGVKLAISGHNSIMTCIRRLSQQPYLWDVSYTNLEDIANKEKFMPRDYIDEEGYHITDKCRDYILPLIQGEDFPKFVNGLPHYVRLINVMVNKKLPPFIHE